MNICIWNRPGLPFEPIANAWGIDHMILDHFQWEEKGIELAETAQVIFVLIELTWESRSGEEFFGFEIARQLRLANCRTPIVFCSFLGRDRFLRDRRDRYAILRTPGHQFCQLPGFFSVNTTEIARNRLSPALLVDIQTYCLNPSGRIKELFHAIKNKLLEQNSSDNRDIHRLLRKLINQLADRDRMQGEQLAEKFAKEIEEYDREQEGILSILNNYKQWFLELESSESEDDEGNAISPVDWYALLIEDEEDIAHQVRSRLAEQGIKSIWAGSGEAAFEILKRDWKGNLHDPKGNKIPAHSITVVICDVRFVNANGDWHQLQGYDIAQKIHQEMHNMVSIVMLTSKKRTILNNVSRPSITQLTWFSKEEVLRDKIAFRSFIERVRYEGNRYYEAVCDLPSFGYWRKKWLNKHSAPLSEYYRFHRMASDYFAQELRISEKALEFIKIARKVRSPSYPELNKINGSLCKWEFQSALRGHPATPSALEKFRIKLIGRRIVIGLYCDGWEMEEIATILQLKALNKSYNNVNQLINSHLALPTDLKKGIPDQLLVEERDWATKYVSESLEQEPLEKMLTEQMIDIVADLKEDLKPHLFSKTFTDHGNISHLDSFLEDLPEAPTHYYLRDYLKTGREIITTMNLNGLRIKYSNRLHTLCRHSQDNGYEKIGFKIFFSEINAW
ncbi:MAG: response regulator [Bacteroidota bacterium]